MMAKDANDVHRELGIEGLRKHGDSLPDLDFDTPAPKEEGNGLATATLAPPKLRRIINPAVWEGLPVPPREWIVPDYIPHKTVTLLSGDGSIGKSLLALQLAVARAIAREWIGLLPEPGRTLILSAEDDADEMHRRLEDIRKYYGVRMADLADIRLVDLVGEDSTLGSLKRGQIEATAMYNALDAYLTEWRPSLVILDVLADMFSGDENSRPQSRQFIGLLKRLARKHDCALLLLAHPSLTGSTGWSGRLDPDTAGLQKPPHCRIENNVLIFNVLIVWFGRENGGRIGRPFCRADVAALRVDLLQNGQEHVIGFRLGGHFVEDGFTLNGDEKAVFPFECDLAASLAVV
jgi:archaellum biogenesis ATPase FlaH